MGAQPIFSFYCDYFSQSSGTHYALRGGASASGLYCGAFCVSGSGSASSANWILGAALSFKPLSFYCDYFAQGSGTTYAFRGGACSNGLYCGVFYVRVSLSAAVANWYLGAALSFK